MQVLYVEDDRHLAHTVELALRKRGYFCHIAELGELAVSLACHNRYDLIVLDIMLPDIDGYEVIERLRDSGVETPFLIQSGLLDRTSMPDGASFGVETFLIKPFAIDEMVERMRSMADQAEREAAATPRYRPRGAAAIVPGAGLDRREHRRFATRKTAEILSLGESEDCMVLDMSHGGAAIRLAGRQAEVPDHFGLRLRSGGLYNCRVCWRYDDKVGVRFTTS